MIIPRRRFLQSAGCGTVVAALNRLLPNWLVSHASAADTIPSFFGAFTPLLPSLEDRIGLPEGFEHQILLKRGDLISPDGARFGDHNDYLAWIVENETHGWLWVNHENSHQLQGEELPLQLNYVASYYLIYLPKLIVNNHQTQNLTY